jgi:SAM-dependent methyltransferase
MNYEYLRLKKNAENAVGTEVLDIGYAELPNPYLSNFHCIGYDLAIPKIKTGYSEEIQGDVNDIVNKLQGYKFDTVILGEIIEHIENPYALLDTIHILLKNGGRVVISTPNPLGFPVFFCELLGLKKYYYADDHKYYFLPRWAEKLIDQAAMISKKLFSGVTDAFLLCRARTLSCYQLIYVCKSQKCFRKSINI